MSYTTILGGMGAYGTWTGIGTMNPTEKLDVRGNITTNSIYKYSAITLPSCSGFYGTAVNVSDNELYYCNSTDWKKVS